MKSEKGQTGVLLAIVLLIVGVGLLAGVGALSNRMERIVVNSDRPLPSDYVPEQSGDCFVPPKGDPLYDEHYAKEVNPYNCQSLESQSEAFHTDSETRSNDWKTTRENIGFFTTMGSFGVVLIVLAVIVLAVILKR